MRRSFIIQFFTLLLPFNCAVFLQAQNLVENGDFETVGQADPLAPASWSGNTLVHAEPWEDDYQFISVAHSPDRYYPCAGGVTLRDGSPNAPVINGAPGAGCGYVGMNEYELIEQEVNGKKHKPYKATFSIRLVADPIRTNTSNMIGPRPVTPHTYSAQDTVRLNILVAKNKIQYDDNLSGPKDFSNGQEIEIVRSLPIVLLSYPFGEWHQVTTTFSSNLDFDWIAFEGVGNSYILIDGIVIEELDDCEVCEEESCGPYDGCIDITHSSNHGTANPTTGVFIHWAIFGLDEVKNIKVELFAANGQKFREINEEFVGSIWRFDGKDNAGTELEAGTYTYDITAWNDCEVRTFDGSFTKGNDSSILTPDPNNNIPFYVPPESCCEDYIFINNFHLPAGEVLTIDNLTVVKAQQGIHIGPGVVIQNLADLVLIAGEEIVISPGVDILPLGNITTLLFTDPCPDFTGNSIVNRSLKKDTEPSFHLGATISPNPSDGSFSVSIPEEWTGVSSLIILDSNGTLIYEEKIKPGVTALDLREFGKGMFVIQIKNGQYSWQEKILTF